MRIKASKLPQDQLFSVKESESQIQKSIIQILKLKKKFPIRFNSGMFRIKGFWVRAYILWNGKSSGLPDIQFIHKGQVHYIEVKKVGGKTSESQDDFIAEMQRINVPVLVSSSWQEVLEYVNSL